MNTPPLIYLAGPISGCNEDQIMGWRLHANKIFAQEGMVGLCPIDVTSEGMDLKSIAVLRDKMDVERCDAVMMNLSGAMRVSIGTMVELGWASAYKKPIILILEKGNLHDHGFVTTLADDIYETVDEAIKAVCCMLQVNK